MPPQTAITVDQPEETIAMAQLYAFRGTLPIIAESALFPTAEITGDVVIGERTIIGAGVKIIGDSHGPVRIGNDVQILDNTVLHLLPDNDLVIDDGVIVGPGAMIHGCRIGAGSVIEPGAIVCDTSELGAGCVVRAGAVVKQRSHFGGHRDRRVPRRRHRTYIRAAPDAGVGVAIRTSRPDTARRRALTGVVCSSITPSGMLRA
jgi:carbonic anhydrase/acetyltransferase-like protein (isoleucine patch superfamily)